MVSLCKRAVVHSLSLSHTHHSPLFRFIFHNPFFILRGSLLFIAVPPLSLIDGDEKCRELQKYAVYAIVYVRNRNAYVIHIMYVTLLQHSFSFASSILFVMPPNNVSHVILLFSLFPSFACQISFTMNAIFLCSSRLPLAFVCIVLCFASYVQSLFSPNFM